MLLAGIFGGRCGRGSVTSAYSKFGISSPNISFSVNPSSFILLAKPALLFS